MISATCPITVNYPKRSELSSDADGSQVHLSLDGSRGAVGIHGTLRDPALFRDALMTAIGVLGSDLRPKSKDRTAYLAYLAKKGKKANAAMWEAQKAFLDESLAADEHQGAVLEPVLTVQPDEVSLEVFSRDESAYARLALHSELFADRRAVHGTAFLDLPPAAIEGLDRLRSYQPVALHAEVSAPAAGPGDPRTLEVPYPWLRGFLQVQTAATLPSVSCELSPIDLYNALFALRTRKAKKSPRALRFELVPGAPPRMILEPWEIVLEGHGPVYRGSAPRVVRTFGRQRLLSLSRVLPYVRSVRVQLLGAGLPVFWVLDLGHASLTLGLTGWTEKGWSSAASFDALMPDAGAAKLADAVRAQLVARGPLPLAEIVKMAGKPESQTSQTAQTSQTSGEKVRAALKLLCLRGNVLFDLARGVYRPRDLLPQPIDESVIRYGSQREAQAHRLLGDGQKPQGEIQLNKIHEVVGEGIEIRGEVTDREARRSYRVSFLLDLEGRAKDGSCGCPTFRRSGMREGPCEHLLALRLFYGRRRAQDEALRQTPEGRKLIRAETRTLSRREPSGAETVYRVSLDDRLVRLVWGARATSDAAAEPRQQRLWFDSDREARDAYFRRLESLSAEGYIDADSF